jgi:hypothetical protein
MTHASFRLTLPSYNEISVPMLRILIREIEAMLGREVTAEEWNGL